MCVNIESTQDIFPKVKLTELISKFFLAPTDTTLHDFIRMIWQLRIQSIIMVTRLFEDGKVKKEEIVFSMY